MTKKALFNNWETIDFAILAIIILLAFIPSILILSSRLNYWPEIAMENATHVKVRTGAATFWIPKDCEADKKELVRGVKTILDVADKQYGLSYRGMEKPKIAFMKESDRLLVDLTKPRLCCL